MRRVFRVFGKRVFVFASKMPCIRRKAFACALFCQSAFLPLGGGEAAWAFNPSKKTIFIIFSIANHYI